VPKKPDGRERKGNLKSSRGIRSLAKGKHDKKDLEEHLFYY